MRYWTKQDPPSLRVKPIPIQVIVKLLKTAYQSPARDLRAIADMACIGFFFLMRPGEHTFSSTETPFHVEDVKLYQGPHVINWRTATSAIFNSATSVSLTFTTQKNGVKGEIITHGRSGDDQACPVRAIIRRLQHHRIHNSPPDAPLCQYVETNGRRRHVKSSHLTTALKMTVRLLLHFGDPLDIGPEEVSARSLRAGGATALLCAGVDSDTIQLIGRWKSDAMIRYLHVSASPTMHHYANKMFAGGHYSFRPGTYVPIRA